MISAKKAKSLALKKETNYLETIGCKIKARALLGYKSVTIYESPYCDWLYRDREKLSPEHIEVMDILVEKGYELELYYAEKQFVQVGLTIKWG